MDFRSLLSKPKLSPKDIGIKLSSANPAATTAHVPPVSKWGQIRNQGDQSMHASSNILKSQPFEPHKPLDGEHTVTSQKSPSPLPFKPKYSDSHQLPDIPTPTVRLSPLPDTIQKKEVPVPPRHTSPNHVTPPIPAARVSELPAYTACLYKIGIAPRMMSLASGFHTHKSLTLSHYILSSNPSTLFLLNVIISDYN